MMKINKDNEYKIEQKIKKDTIDLSLDILSMIKAHSRIISDETKNLVAPYVFISHAFSIVLKAIIDKDKSKINKEEKIKEVIDTFSKILLFDLPNLE